MTVLRDHIAATIQEALPIITELRKQEDAIQNARQARNKAQGDAAEGLARQERQKLYDLKESAAIYHHLEVTKQASATEFRTAWQRKETPLDCLKLLPAEIKELYEGHFREPNLANLNLLPPCSFMLQFTFVLEQPLLSKDDQDFCIIDNPVRKDTVFRLPYIAPSSWKGCLRAALRQLDHDDDTEAIRRLFGNKKGTELHEEFHAGRLHFFPTFFTLKSLEIINPHDRQRRVGKNPIWIESVPMNALGLFTMLYVPCNRIGEDSYETRRELAQDLRLLAEGLPGMFLIYGFGAKTSSGFGTAKEQLIDGFQFSHNWEAPIISVPAMEQPEAKKMPRTVAKSFAELGSVSAQRSEDTGIGFKELEAYLERVSAELLRQAEQQEEVRAERSPHDE